MVVCRATSASSGRIIVFGSNLIIKVACYDEELVIHSDRSRLQARAEFARQVRNGILRMLSLASTSQCDILSPKTGGFWSEFEDHRCWLLRWAHETWSHALQAFYVHSSFISNAFPELTPHWQRIKVLRCCGVELPIIFTHKAFELWDLSSGWWVLA